MWLRIVTLPGWLLSEPSELALQMLERGDNFRRLAAARYSAINGKRDLYLNRIELSIYSILRIKYIWFPPGVRQGGKGEGIGKRKGLQ